jgi:hypothetical protein
MAEATAQNVRHLMMVLQHGYVPRLARSEEPMETIQA